MKTKKDKYEEKIKEQEQTIFDLKESIKDTEENSLDVNIPFPVYAIALFLSLTAGLQMTFNSPSIVFIKVTGVFWLIIAALLVVFIFKAYINDKIK